MSDFFKEHNLGRIYKGGAGRGVRGKITRKNFKTTLTIDTFVLLNKITRVGPGQYGGPVVEMAIRVMGAGLGITSAEEVAKELRDTLVDPEAFKAGLIELLTHL